MSVTSLRHHGTSRAVQQGLSLVELMVGVAIGLIVVAAAAMMVSTQLGDNRRLLLETQIQQDMRSTIDIITREMRRASYTPGAVGELWYEGKTGAIAQNSFGTITPTSGVGLTEVEFSYRRRSGDQGPYGYKLEGNAIKSKIGGQWQTLTDTSVMRVTAFNVDLAAPVSFPLPCPRLCADGTQACWPSLQLRTATITLTGQSVSDPAIVRTLRTQVRLRNDMTVFNDVTICPA